MPPKREEKAPGALADLGAVLVAVLDGYAAAAAASEERLRAPLAAAAAALPPPAVLSAARRVVGRWMRDCNEGPGCEGWPPDGWGAWCAELDLELIAYARYLATRGKSERRMREVSRAEL